MSRYILIRYVSAFGACLLGGAFSALFGRDDPGAFMAGAQFVAIMVVLATVIESQEPSE